MANSNLSGVRAGDNGGAGGIPFAGKPFGSGGFFDDLPTWASTVVRLVDMEGEGLAGLKVTVRDEFGVVIASQWTDADGLVTFVTSMEGEYTVEAPEVGVMDLDFDPGLPLLIVVP